MPRPEKHSVNEPNLSIAADAVDTTAVQVGVSSSLVDALRRILRPLVRLLVARQVTYPYLANLLKGIFVDVAANDIPHAGKRLTDSRISLMTGVHRKDVRRLLDESDAVLVTPANVSLGARLVARWNGEAAYLGPDGLPLPLPRQVQADGSVSFERLVAEESKDIRARAVLDEWLRLGLVELSGDDHVRLCSGAFVPQAGDDEKLYYLGRNVRDHLETAVHNVQAEGKPRMERSVYADGLSAESVSELADLAERLGMDVLRALNQRARDLKKGQSKPGEQRMALGLYFFTDGDGDAN